MAGRSRRSRRAKARRPRTTNGSWAQVRHSWPLHVYPLTLEVVHPRRMTVIEWAALRVLEEALAPPPTLVEASELLGLGDTPFLHEAVQSVVDLGAAKIGPAVSSDPGGGTLQGQLTPRGRKLFRLGKIDGAPARQGLELAVDAWTREPVPCPKKSSASPTRPLPGATPVPAPPSRVGIDLVRRTVQTLCPELVEGGGFIRRSEVREGGAPTTRYRDVRVEVHIRAGAFQVRSPDLPPKARALIRVSALFEAGLLSRTPLSDAWDLDGDGEGLPRLSWEAWQPATTSSLSARDAETWALELLDGAKQEARVHALWLRNDKVRAAFTRAASRGVRAVEVEREEEGSLLLVDGQDGLLAAAVLLRHDEGTEHVELAGRLAVEEARRRWPGGATGKVSRPRPRGPKAPRGRGRTRQKGRTNPWRRP